jgi:F-type H+-transporting ATPase subunit a
MAESPLTAPVAFRIARLPITVAVVVTWGIILVLGVGSALATRRLALAPGRFQAALELVVTGIEGQIDEITRLDGRRYVPLLGTLFIYILVANLSSLLPGVHAPTATLETAAALATVVFFSVHAFGITRRGLAGYLGHFLRPKAFFLPLNVVSEMTRTFSLMIRLFGNMLSGQFVVGIVLALAGLFVPLPLMALELLTGVVQAYIFAVLAAVFIGAAVGAGEPADATKETT